MSRLRLTLAASHYDRTRALMDGSVQPEGIELNYLSLPVEEVFFRMLRHREFDVAEMSLSSYMISLTKLDRAFVALPIYPSRYFRHSCIYVHAGAGIRTPGDLVGKRIGTPEYQMTAAVWIRGMLADEHAVPVDSVTHVTGGAEQPGRAEKIKLALPPNIRLERIGPTQTLSQMLHDGEIDALYTARTPSTFKPGNGQVLRLFPDHAQVERDYFRRTRIFPIMHVIAMRRDVYEANRWIAQSLCRAFALAQRRAYDDLSETVAHKTMLPWLGALVEEARQEMGDDFWPYGLERNHHALATLARYSFEQGLTPRLLDPAELFAPESLESFLI